MERPIRPSLITRQPRTRPPTRSFSAIVKMTESSEEDTSEEVKKKFLTALDPVANKLHVENIRKLRYQAVLVEVRTQEDLNKIVNIDRFTEAGLSVDVANKRRPRIHIMDVLVEFSKEDCLKAIYEQNGDILGEMTQRDLKLNCNVLFRTGRRDKEITNWVVEVSLGIRNTLRWAEKVYFSISLELADVINVKGLVISQKPVGLRRKYADIAQKRVIL